MRFIIAALAVMLAADLRAESIRVYVVAGQSNAVGGLSGHFPPAPLDSQDNLFAWKIRNLDLPGFLESTAWDTVHSLYPNDFGVSYGPEVSFAYEMQHRLGENVAIIKVAQGGAGLAAQWMPGKPIYAWASAKVQSSLAELVTAGYSPELAGFLWIQGETDAFATNTATAYAENMSALAAALRSDFNAPSLPIYLNLLHEQANYSQVATLRQEQQDFLATDANALGFDPSDMPLSSDLRHYGDAGILGLGRRFADLIIPSGDFDDDGDVDAADLDAWKAGAGDANADGLTDGADFLVWQRQFVAPMAAAVPEPSACLLAALLLAIGFFGRTTH